MNTKQFYARFAGFSLVAGILLTLLGVLMLSASNGPPVALGTGPLILILGILQKTTPLLSFENDHFRWRPAVLRSEARILYRDMSDVENEQEKLRVRLSSAEKDTVIDLRAFAPDDREIIRNDLLSHLKQRKA